MFNRNLYNISFHKGDISKDEFLITGGAGFIGFILVEYLLKSRAGILRVIDNLSNGYLDKINFFSNFSNFESMGFRPQVTLYDGLD